MSRYRIFGYLPPCPHSSVVFMHNITFLCTSTWTKFREGGSGIQNPLSKTWDNKKKFIVV